MKKDLLTKTLLSAVLLFFFIIVILVSKPVGSNAYAADETDESGGSLIGTSSDCGKIVFDTLGEDIKTVRPLA